MKDYLTERKRILYIAILIMLITAIPYIIAYSNQGDTWRFTGFIIGVEDGNSYLAKMRSGSEGNWLFFSPHSAEEQKGVVAYLPYILLGKLASGEGHHEQLVALYHFARILFGVLAILATYDLISIFIEKENYRHRALVLTVLGGGLGWLLVLFDQKGFLGSLPLEFISPESFGFLGLFGFPHLAAARALLLWGIVLYLKKSQGYLAGVLWLIAGFFQPMVTALAWVVIGVYFIGVTILKWRDKGNIFILDPGLVNEMVVKSIQAIVISAPIVIYTAYIFLFDPYFKAWSIQNRFPSPHVVHYFLAYGLILPFAISGIRKVLRKGKLEGILLAGWLLVSPILIYAPVITQRRLAEGIWPVLIIGLISNFSHKDKVPTYLNLISILLLPSTALIYFGSTLQAIDPAEPVFRTYEEVQAFDFIDGFSMKQDIVLSSFAIGNNIPAWTPTRVVMGHGPETVGLDDIRQDIDGYFNSEEDFATCQDFYGKYNIDLLFWGPVESQIWNYKPDLSDCLVIIYQSQGYTVYQVNY